MDGQEPPLLATTAVDCQKGIANLLVAVEADDCCVKDVLRPRDVLQMQERYDQWAGNLGALQNFKSESSLVHRLRHAPLVGESILRTLTDLLASGQAGEKLLLIISLVHGLTLSVATDIAAGRRPNRVSGPLAIDADTDTSEFEISSESDVSSDQSLGNENDILAPTSEIRELVSAINIGLDSLFKASMFIRNHAPTDKRRRATKTKPFDNTADVMYVKDRYPLIAQNNGALAVRLGEANARRRQYFKYRRQHEQRLSQPKEYTGHLVKRPGGQPEVTAGNVENTGNAGDSGNPGDAGPTKSTLTGETRSTQFAETEATEFIADEAAQAKMFGIGDVPPAKSVVSFATSIAESSDDELPFPPVPTEGSGGSPFICPYCLTIQQLKRQGMEQQWRKHVVQDLEPYICTFPSCGGLGSFHSQRAWFEHELEVHRSQWVCPRCPDTFESPEYLEAHIDLRHGGIYSHNQLPMITDQSKRPVSSIEPGECPFCDDPWAGGDPTKTSDEVLVVSTEQFRKHLGHHMQQVALFSLPRLQSSQDRSLGSVDVGASDRDDASEVEMGDEGCRLRTIIVRKRAIFRALSFFLTQYLPKTPVEYYRHFNNFTERNLKQFGFKTQEKHRLAYRAADLARDFKAEFNLREEEFPVLAKLSFFDIFILCDNSGPMNRNNRIQIQSQTLRSIVKWARRVNPDGIFLRFFNGDQDTNALFDNVIDPSKIDDLVGRVTFEGETLIASGLLNKVKNPFVQRAIESKRTGAELKPRFVFIITSSEPDGANLSTALLDLDFVIATYEYGFMAVVQMISRISKVSDDKLEVYLGLLPKWQGDSFPHNESSLEGAMEDHIEKEEPSTGPEKSTNHGGFDYS
ncbi:hypothetical protein FQN54_002954 [Arachnomyces sp. PD_36]|nr:hypothetical protein FQN54_002954 [Arachnomyces sp. PD_36]